MLNILETHLREGDRVYSFNKIWVLPKIEKNWRSRPFAH